MYPSTDPRQLWAAADRVVDAEITAVRTAVLRTIRELGATIGSEGFAAVVATRGSQLGGATLSPARVPIELQVTFEPAGAATAVGIRIEDRWRSPGKQAAAAAAYRQAFDQVLLAIDTALSRLDPAAAASFNAPSGNGGQAGSTAVVQKANRLEASLTRRSSRLLDGKSAPTPGQLGRGDASGTADDIRVAISSPDQVARLDFPSVYVMLTAGQLIAARPGTLPPALTAQVRQLVIELEQRIDTNAPPPANLALQVSTEQVPVVNFLRQQAQLRDQLPLRTLQVCTTCKLEKVINPDFVQMRERSRRMKVLSGSFGAVIGAHHISPYVLVGRLVQLKNSDPDFVCQRCQGLDADETIITFCPRCGDRRTESVLRECGKCKLDYRTLVKAESIWQDIPASWSNPQLQPEPPVQAAVAAGWFPDHAGRYEYRYWDGQAWTRHVSTGGVASIDSV